MDDRAALKWQNEKSNTHLFNVFETFGRFLCPGCPDLRHVQRRAEAAARLETTLGYFGELKKSFVYTETVAVARTRGTLCSGVVFWPCSIR